MDFIRHKINDFELKADRITQLWKQGDNVDHIEQEPSQYKRDIMRLLIVLKNSNEDDTQEAMTKIGQAVYLGGSQSAKLGLSVLPRLVNSLRSRFTSTKVKIEALKTLSEISTQYKDYQDKFAEQGGLETLFHLAADFSNERLSNWAYYALTIMIADNIPLMREVRKLDNLEERLARSAFDSVKGTKKYAEIFAKLLGIKLTDQ